MLCAARVSQSSTRSAARAFGIVGGEHRIKTNERWGLLTDSNHRHWQSVHGDFMLTETMCCDARADRLKVVYSRAVLCLIWIHSCARVEGYRCARMMGAAVGIVKGQGDKETRGGVDWGGSCAGRQVSGRQELVRVGRRR